jgi:branched-chain amino acid aminotransferase
VFAVKDGVIATPGHSASILDGINRKSVIEIAGDLGYEVQVRDIARSELALADELFLTGTAAELTPVREIDDIELGPPGEVTRAIQQAFDDALHGRSQQYAQWLDVVPVPSEA